MGKGSPVDLCSPELEAKSREIAADRALPRVTIADHELLRRIGRGSYGEVWLAKNRMGTYRAVKIVHRSSFKDQRPYERELSGIRKFEPLSRSYDGFIDVLQIGINTEEDYFYYVMELGDDQVSGQTINPETYSPNTLARQSARGRLATRECLQLGLALSQALVELHKHGLVHRDIKPSNIIFVNGVAKLADIGLVAEVDEARSFVGTEGFIPPEGPGTAQADIYSLGKVLYEISTGKDRHEFPKLGTLLDEIPDRDLFLELNEVILNACKIELSARYRSAQEMHDDLVMAAEGKSVKSSKLFKRRLARVKEIAGISLFTLVLVASITFQIYRERRNVVEARQREVGAHIANGNAAVKAGDLFGSLVYFADAADLEQGKPNEHLHRLWFGSVLQQCPKLEQMWFAEKLVKTAQFSPDGKSLLIVESHGKAQVFDIASGKPISPRFGQAKGLQRGGFSPDGMRVVTCGEDHTACVWNVSDGSLVLSLKHTNRVAHAAFSANGQKVLTGCADGFARIFDMESGRLDVELGQHDDAVISCAQSPDGSRVATTSQDNTARLWDAKTGKQIGKPLVHPTWPWSASFSLDGKLLLTAGTDGKARVWSLTGDTPQRIPPDLEHADEVHSADFSPDGQYILTSSLDSTMRLWSAEDHRPIGPVFRHGDRITSASISPDGYRIASGCSDGTVRIWNLAGAIAPKPLRHSFSGDESRFLTVTNGLQVWDTLSGRAVSPVISISSTNLKLNGDGGFVLVAFDSSGSSNEPQRRIDVLETSTGKPVGKSLFIASRHTGAVLSEDAKRLVTYGGRTLQSWNVATGSPLSPVVPIGNRRVVLNKQGTVAATWKKNVVLGIDVASGRLLYEVPRELDISHLEFSPDGSRLAMSCQDTTFTKTTVGVVNAITGKSIFPSLQHEDGVACASFSPNGAFFATACQDYSGMVWDANTGLPLVPPFKHANDVEWVAFSPDNQWIASASLDHSARIWNAKTGEPLTPPLRHIGPVQRAKFLNGARYVITCDTNDNRFVWPLPQDDRSTVDLKELAYLLNGEVPKDAAGMPDASRLLKLQKIWSQMRPRYPTTFTTSTEEIRTWHEYQIRRSIVVQNDAATAFHLRRLSLLQSTNSSWTEGLETLSQHLKDRN